MLRGEKRQRNYFYNAPPYRLPAFITADLPLGCNIFSSQLPRSLVMMNVNRMEISWSAEEGLLKEGMVPGSEKKTGVFCGSLAHKKKKSRMV